MMRKRSFEKARNPIQKVDIHKSFNKQTGKSVEIGNSRVSVNVQTDIFTSAKIGSERPKLSVISNENTSKIPVQAVN